MSLTSLQERKNRALNNDFEYFCRNVLKIKDKSGAITPFLLNKAQRYIHEQIEEQRMRTGRVRAIILKGRQQGCSTYVGGRFYWKSTRKKGKKTFILTHESNATDNLFGMVETFYDESDEFLRPPLKTKNAKRMIFDEINSSYQVGTAGNKKTGRSGTVQLFHGSEVAFWENTDDIESGAMQTVADLPDTEIILESTANGIGNMFYGKFTGAMRGENQYIAIFVPWFWQDEYRTEVPEGFEMTPSEVEYKENYDLDLGQIAWRRNKIKDFSNSGLDGEWKFKQEYPANPIEAFQSSGNPLISQQSIIKARKATFKDLNAPLIMGVDAARDGDRTAIVFRRGREVPKYYVWPTMDQMQLVGIVANFINKHHPAQVFIDVAHGLGTYDRLCELGFKSHITPVHFGEEAIEKETYLNKRAEMWCMMRDWFKQGARIPDSDELHADIACVPNYKQNSDNRIKLESKEKIKSTYGLSPDIGDALALTFAYPVSHEITERRIQKANSSSSVLKSVSKIKSITKNKGRTFRLAA